MKVLLMHPPYHLEKAEAVLPMLGIRYISSYLKQNGYECKVIECVPNNLQMKDIPKILKDENPDVVGVTLTTPLAPAGYKIAQMAKEFNPKITVVAGGPHVSALFHDILNHHKEVDVLIRGEGELVMLNLVKELENKHPDLNNVKGICFRDKTGKMVITGNQEYIMDLDKLPFPDRSGVDLKLFRPSTKWYNRMPFTTMMTSRGCPFDCLFCDSHIIWGRRTRFRSAENILDEIRYLVNELGIREIIFYDDTFTLDKKRVEKICDTIINEKIDITWGCLSRVDRIDENIVIKMKKAGCHIMSFGIESGSEKMLKKMRKHTNKDQAIEAIRILNKHGMDSATSFVFGIPGETKETMRETIDFVKKLNPTYAQFFRAVPFPGTDLYHEAKAGGMIGDFNWENYSEVSNFPMMKLDTITEKDFNTLFKKAYREFYLRPRKMLQYGLRMTSVPKIKGFLRASRTMFKISRN